MKAKKRFGWGRILLVLAAFSGVLWAGWWMLFWYRHERVFGNVAPFEHRDRIASPGRTFDDNEVRGRLLILEGTPPRISGLQWRLPAELRATRAEEIGTVALVHRGESTAGEYFFGGKAIQRHVSIWLVDHRLDEEIGLLMIGGETPPHVREVPLGGGGDYRGKAPTKDRIVQALTRLPRKPASVPSPFGPARREVCRMTERITCLTSLPDGRLVICLADGRGIIRHPDGKTLVLKHPEPASAIAAAPAGSPLVVGCGKQLFIWAVDAGKLVHRIDVGEWVFCVAIDSSGGTVAAGGARGCLRAYDAKTGDAKPISRGGGDGLPSVLSVGFLKDGRVAAGTADGRVEAFPLHPLQEAQPDDVRAASVFGKWGGEFGRDARMACSADESEWVVLMGLPFRNPFPGTRCHLHLLRAGDSGDSLLSRSSAWAVGEAQDFALSSDGRWVVIGGVTGQLRMFDLRTKRPVGAWRGHQGRVAALAFARDNSLLSGGDDGVVLSWDLESVAAAGPRPNTER